MIRLAIPLILLLVPLAEIALFVVVGGRIGILATIAIVVLTAMAGAILLRQQGLQVLREAQASAERGEPPVGAVVDGLCLFAAGLLLITPGFLTDSIGFALFVPAFRRWFAGWVWRRIRASATVKVRTHGREFRRGPADDRDGRIIEGEIVKEPADADEAPRNGDGSPWKRS